MVAIADPPTPLATTPPFVTAVLDPGGAPPPMAWPIVTVAMAVAVVPPAAEAPTPERAAEVGEFPAAIAPPGDGISVSGALGALPPEIAPPGVSVT